MKIVFAGSSEFAIPALEELLACRKHEVALVLSQPARPKGRRQVLEDTPLAQCAAQNSLSLYCPEDVNCAESIEKILSAGADILITASYGAFLGRTLRKAFPLGAINLHPSLLPKYRGASPIRAALLAGEKVTGNSIFRLAAKMDAGDILVQEKLEILPLENYSSLHLRLANLAAQSLIDYLDDPQKVEPKPQDHSLATYSKMVQKSDLVLDFSRSAGSLQDAIRAYALEPGAYGVFRGKQLKILEAELIEDAPRHAVEEICEIIKNKGFVISTGDGGLLIRKVQAAGKKMMDAWAYHLGARLQIGERFGL